MADVLTLATQAVAAYDGVDDLATSGPLVSGEFDYLTSGGSASAMRFALPVVFDPDTDQIDEAILNLWIKRINSEEEPAAGQKHTIGVLAAGSQVLPTTSAGVQGAAVGSEVKTIGTGTYSPALDYSVGTSYGWVAIDLTEAFAEALAAGRLDGTHVVVMILPNDYQFGAHVSAHGLTEANPPTIDLEYSLADAFADFELSLEQTLDGITVEAEAYAPERYAAADVTLAGVTIAAETAVAIHAAGAFALDGIWVDAAAVIFSGLSAEIKLDGVAVAADAIQGDQRFVSGELVVGGLTVAAESFAGLGASLDSSLAGITVASQAVTIPAIRHRLLADAAPQSPFTLFA